MPATLRFRDSRPTSASTPGRRSLQGQDDGDATTPSTSIASATTAAPARARSRRSCRSTPQTQPACLIDGVTGLVDCGNWARVGVVDRPTGAVVGHLHRQADAPRHRRREPHRLHRARRHAPGRRRRQTSDTTWQAYNQYGGGSLYCDGPQSNAGTAYYSCAGRATKVSYNRPFDTRAHDRDQLPVQRRIPDGALARGQRLRRQVHQPASTPIGARARSGRRAASRRCSSRSATTSTGRPGSAPASRPRATPASTSRSSAATRCTGRRGASRASTATNTPYRTLVSYKDTLGGVKLDPMPNVDDRHVARHALRPAGRRRRPAGERADRPDLDGQLRHVGDQRAGLDGEPALLANTRVATLTSGAATLAPDTLGYEWDEDLDNGFAPGRPDSPVVDDGRRRREDPRLRRDGRHRHRDAHPDALPPRRAARSSSAPAPCSGRGASTAITTAAPAPPDQAMQQATVNLLADMGAQPASLQSAPIRRAADRVGTSTDAFAPTSVDRRRRPPARRSAAAIA